MRLGATKSSATSSYNGLGNQLWDLGGARPSLDLNFAGNKNLSDSISTKNLITFTRASSGTYVDSQGVIRTATTNLLLRSEEFNDAYWTKNRIQAFGSGSIANAIQAPNGTTTADKIVEDSTTGFHYAIPASSSTVASGAIVTASVYAKAGERTGLGIFPYSSAAGCRFNLSSGTVQSADAGVTATIQSVGNGWYRCVASITAPGTSASPWLVILNDSFATNYTGDGTSGIYLWGAQLEQSSTVGEYIPTTSTINSAPRFDHNPTTRESLGLLVEEQRTNLLLRSQEFQGSGWVRGGLTVTADQEIAPDGTQTADTCTLTSSGHALYTFVSVAQSTTYTFSFYAKRGTGTTATYAITNDSAGGASIVANTSYYSQTSSSAWTRITVTFTTPVGCTSIGAFLQRDSGSSSGTMFFWGAQLEAGSFPTSYIPTTTAAVTRSADVASITGSNFGVSRTNLLLRSEEFNDTIWGPVAGTVTANAETSPVNTLTADKLIAANGGPAGQLAQGVTIASGATVTGSVYAKAGGFDRLELVLLASNNTTPYGRSTFNPNTGVVTTAAFTANGGTNASSTVQALSNGWYRFSVTVTYPAVTSAGMRLVVSNSDSSNGDGVKGVFLWGAQLETGSTATAYIPTTTAAVTVVDSPWYRQDQSTVYCQGLIPPGLSAFPTLHMASDGSVNNQWSQYAHTSGLYANLRTGNVGQGDPGVIGSPVVGAAYRLATGFIENNVCTAWNGTVGTPDTSASMPTALSEFRIGAARTGGAVINTTISRLTYWPSRLPNATLQQITR